MTDEQTERLLSALEKIAQLLENMTTTVQEIADDTQD